MLVSDRKHKHFSTIARNSVAVIATVVLAVKIAAAQNLPPAVPPALPGTSAIRLPGLSDSPRSRATSSQPTDRGK